MHLGDTNILQLLLRTTLAFLSLLILTRFLGKQQMSQMTFFNYITGITIGSVSANIISMSNEPFIDEFIGLIWWCALAVLSEYINLKFLKARNVINGQPTMVIRKGKLLKEAITSTKLDMGDLSMMLRSQNIFSITEVDYAILETNGSLSILKKEDHLGVTKSDMKVPTSQNQLMPTDIIVDGKIVEHNLKERNLSYQWLEDQLKSFNVKNIEDVFYAELESDGTLYIDKGYE
ncbi:YetF domain-containing protein [Clostridium amazonitimonense]|uniref:YetF domain-containing protein n=1 Tax=Clostridium amazonitimonense TaxID=1499689 RepID=UPI000509E896|nr:DUF421 domain-containing protein [Clostridium amazonitimonense]